MNVTRTSLIIAAVALVTAGCEDKTAPPSPTSPAPNHAPANPPAAAPTATGNPQASGPATAGAGNTVNALGVSLPLPAGWKSVPPSNPMRKAEVQVPDASGDVAKACTIAISTAGGEIQANVDRWGTQVLDANGQPTKPNVQTKTVDGMKVTTAELTGTYAGMNEAPHSNWTLRAAIVETPNGMLFIKMTGPAEQMAAQGAAFGAMIDGLKKQQ